MTAGMCTGIDPHANGLIVARTEIAEGQPMQVAVEFRALDAASMAVADSVVAISVPDNQVIVKPVQMRVPAGIDITPRLHFELAASLLEPESEFAFEIIPCSREDRFLGLIYRRERLEELWNRLAITGSNREQPTMFEMRAAALGKGYIKYARPVSDGLVCLADLADGLISVCFVYDRKIVSLGSLAVDNSNPADERACRRLGIDLKTFVNFRLSALAQEGLSVPLATLFVSGELASEGVTAAVASLFTARVAEPSVDTAQVRLSGDDPEFRLSDALVALGLTVN